MYSPSIVSFRIFFVMYERIEGVIRGVFKGGGYIQQQDGQLFIYYESHLKDTSMDILKKNTRVIALLLGVTVIQIKLKEDNAHWGDAMFQNLLIM